MEAEGRGMAEVVFGAGDSTCVVGRLIERAEGGFASGWSWTESRCGLGARAAGGSSGVERVSGVEVAAEDVVVGFGSAEGDLAGGLVGCKAGGGGVE